MARRRSQFKPFPLADILQKVMKKQGIPLTTGDPYLRRVWNEAVGDGIAAQTAPENIKRGTLFVKVSSSVWIHHLQFLKKEILQRFNELHGKGTVRELNLSIGAITASTSRPRSAASAAIASLTACGGVKDANTASGSAITIGTTDKITSLSARDERLMKESLAAVSDPELREILRRVMARAISRRRFLEKRKDR